MLLIWTSLTLCRTELRVQKVTRKKKKGSFRLTLPNNKFLDRCKLKAFADDKINVTLKQKFFSGWLENIAGKGENAHYQHFIHFPQCFLKTSVPGLLKVGPVW